MSFIIFFNVDPLFNHWFEFHANKIGPTQLNFKFNLIDGEMQIENKLSIFSIESSLIAMGSDCMFILHWIKGLYISNWI